MLVKEFNFSFKFYNKRIDATCSVMQGGIHVNVPMYRTSIKQEKKHEVYIFYEINEEAKRFFTFDKSAVRGEIAAKIENVLKKH